MARYQNIFSPDADPDARACERSPAARASDRTRNPGFSYWMGKLGDAQIGPIYLGWTGVFSLAFGIMAIEIIGLNMWASVNWDPVQFVRQLPWLALEPPRQIRLQVFPPLQEGGWWLIAGFLPDDVDPAVVDAHHARPCPRSRHPRDMAFASAIWLYLVLGFIRPVDGQLERGGAVRHLPAPRLDQQFLADLRQSSSTNPFPHARHAFWYGFGVAVCDAWGDDPGGHALRRRPRIEQITDRPCTAAERALPSSGAGRGLPRDVRVHPSLAWWCAVLCTLTGHRPSS